MPRKKKPPVDSDNIPVDERAQMVEWFRNQTMELDRAYNEDRERWRIEGVHPSPLFQSIVRTLGSQAMPRAMIATMLKMKPKELEEYYGEDYALGLAYTAKNVTANIVRIATSTTDPNAAKVAMQFLERVVGGDWKPPAQKLITQQEKPSGRTFDADNFTPEEQAQLEAMIERIENAKDKPGVPREEDAPIIE